MTDKQTAQVGFLIQFTHAMLLRIQHDSRTNTPPLAFGYTEQALLELVNELPDKNKQLRRIHRAAHALTVLFASYKDDEGGPLFSTACKFIAICQFAWECKKDGRVEMKEGTHLDFLFQELNKNIEVLAGDILKEADDLPQAKQVIEKAFAEV